MIPIVGLCVSLRVLPRDAENRQIYGENPRITPKFCKTDGMMAKISLKGLTCIIHSRHALSSQSLSDWSGFPQNHTDFPSKAVLCA